MAINPDCKDCHGTGEILLLNRTVKCFCLDREIDTIDDGPLHINENFYSRLREIEKQDGRGWDV